MKELKQIEKLTGKTLRRLESEWPMQVFEETVRQPRPPRPGREPKAEVKNVVVPEKKTEKKLPVKPETKVQPKAAKPTQEPPKQLTKSAPVSKATPLERPVPAKPARPARSEQPMRSMQRDQAEKPAFTYADLLKERRKARRPLSTGNDRF
jgi:hypothetical protein